MKLTFLLPALAVAALAGFSSCSDNENEDITTTVNKAGAVETVITSEHLDSTRDVIVTTHKVWANYNLYRTIEHRDTVPALGTGTATAENENGEQKEVKLKKDYEFYVTVQ
ncbi:hypothetical protein [Chitinophaga vietnamensis]|uniref:hypothetical protein n=1 Tax=Chitinophaga vietnamensis TaxID=2593957 RepID=UPI0011780002|nr:hypothetical protein [Chitinophaga vietnamensis]